MKSKIYLSEKVKNTDRRFGSALEYYPVMVVHEDGSEFPGMMTIHTVDEIEERAARNPEDIPEDKTFWGSLFG